MKTFVLFALCVAVASAAAITKQNKGDETSDGKADSGDYVTDRETIAKAIKKHGFYSYIDELGDLCKIASIPEDFDPKAYRIPKHQSGWIDE